MKNLILIASFALCFIACNNSNTPEKVNDVLSKPNGLNAGTGNFTINTPVGWTRNDTTVRNIKVLFLYPPVTSTQQFHPNLNVISESMAGYDFDKYFAKNMEGMKQYLQNFAVVKTGDIEAGGIKGKWVHYTQTQNGNDMENVYYMFPKNGICYGITATTLRGDMEHYRTAFDGVVKTFEAH